RRAGCAEPPADVAAGGAGRDHRRHRRLAAARGHAAHRDPSPAAEGPHPASRHVPDPGRRPARAPDPCPPGADRAERGRPVAARRDRGLETRPSPADLPADRVHLRPGRGRPGNDAPDGLPSGPPQGTRDGLLEASVPGEFTGASTSLAVGWTDLDSSSPPPPRGTSDCADPEASWGHRKNNLLRSEDELFYGWYLSAGIRVPGENGP